MDFPPDAPDKLDKRFSNLKTLGTIAKDGRDYNTVAANLLKESQRISTIYLQDDQLHFHSKKGDIAWASESHSGTRVADFSGKTLARSTVERNWRA